MSAQQRVNAAIHLAVTKILATKADTQDAHALGQSIGRRLQGTYGAELRKLVDRDADANADELVAVVIAPHEHSLDDALAKQIRDDREAGARDRVRKRNYGEPVDLSIPIPDDITQRVAALRACVVEPTFTPPPKVTVDRDNLRVVPPEIYEAAAEGRRQFQENRRARLDAAK